MLGEKVGLILNVNFLPSALLRDNEMITAQPNTTNMWIVLITRTKNNTQSRSIPV